MDDTPVTPDLSRWSSVELGALYVRMLHGETRMDPAVKAEWGRRSAADRLAALRSYRDHLATVDDLLA